MKNLHLVSLDPGFNARLMVALNTYFPRDNNYFVWRAGSKCPAGFDNAITDPKWFSTEYINQHHVEWDQLFLHELFLSDRQLLQLSDEAAKKITWVVWGHDLYRKPAKPSFQPRSIALFAYRWLRQYSVFFRGFQRKVAAKVSQFRRIAIGYPYDEVYIRNKYGNTVPVVYGPYFSKDASKDDLDSLRKLHLENRHSQTNIMIGHCGAAFLQQEKYLKRLAKYKNEGIHIYLIMSYLASQERIEAIGKLARSIYQEDQFTIITESMPQDAYFRFLTKMDVVIFAFRQQSALGNVKRLAYIGAKLYFDPRGVLAKGFLASGVESFDCRKIGKLSFEEFIRPAPLPAPDSPLFDGFDLKRCVSAWEEMLTE